MKKLIFILFSVFSLNTYPQANSDAERAFVMHFIEENILMIKDKANTIYNTSVIHIKIDVLGDYNSDILFYRFKLGTNEIKAIDEKLEISFNSSSCDEYILAFNIINNTTYRVKGFNGNDLLFLMRSIHQTSSERKSTKKILSELRRINIGVDFTGIYHALKNFDYEATCLKACSEPKVAHDR